ncbi:SCO2521 family protein [Umezawaea sp. Da 62-37]|uniref:SCO2521 family protein n=1 Tax=Umezawaea sp. Da 62-37 TaxID=3075927 RepID=UPI0028F6D2B5|nr:SCO2521 family protein [Umezawaea sp. Da 62-37]WNV88368.1 SCO2521 family protein [Umezawaea sp. Da 62-37]
MILGEVRTGLLRNSLPLPRQAVVDLLSLRPGRQVVATDRPVNRTVSPDSIVGVDCTLATEPQTKARGIGTVVTHAVVVGGAVLQSSSCTRLEWADYRERKAWTHYTHRRGVVDVLGNPASAQIVDGSKKPVRQRDTLDLGAVCQRMMMLVQGRPQLDYKPGLLTQPTRLRWNAIGREGARPTVHLHIDDEVRRTVDVVAPPELLEEVSRFCEDLALHDWLYTTLGNVVEQAERDMASEADPMKLLGAALTLLARLWMPSAHVHPALRPLWADLEEVPGFSRSWRRNVSWIRDQISMSTLTTWQDARPF